MTGGVNDQGAVRLAEEIQWPRPAEDSQTTREQGYVNPSKSNNETLLSFSERLCPKVYSKTEDGMDTSIHYMDCQNEASSCSNYIELDSELLLCNIKWINCGEL